LALPKQQAPDIAALFELMLPAPQSVLIAENPFEADAAVEALYDCPPDIELLSRLCGRAVVCEALPDRDWIRHSLEGLPPVRAGRFFLHGVHDSGLIPPGVIPICIEAGLAFGTGHHESTALCLDAMSQLSKRQRYKRALDVGCGTGVLAIAAAKLWKSTIVASDIDPVAITTAQANAKANHEPGIRFVCADGLDHPVIRESRPYDLVLANILARPLTRLAPAIAQVARRGGTLVLSGLLRDQENLVLSFYRGQNFVLLGAYRDGPWSALILKKNPLGLSEART
jgi:ribosomal protein L11 methyltransferase